MLTAKRRRTALFEYARARSAYGLGRTVRVPGVDRALRRLYDPDRRSESYTLTTARLRDGSLFAIDTRSYLEWRLYLYGEYEPDVQRVIVRSLRPGDAAIDVGANIGIHTVSMARAVGDGGRVLAVEPLAGAVERLRQNLALNGLGDRVVVVAKAAGSREGSVPFYPPRAAALNQATGSLLALEYLDRPVEVEVVPLDVLAREHQLDRVRLIKIDVEGGEADVLAGALDLIREQRPSLLFEYNPRQFGPAGRTWDEFRRLTRAPYRYALFEVGRRTLRPAGPDPPERSYMVLAAPPEARWPR